MKRNLIINDWGRLFSLNRKIYRKWLVGNCEVPLSQLGTFIGSISVTTLDQTPKELLDDLNFRELKLKEQSEIIPLPKETT